MKRLGIVAAVCAALVLSACADDSPEAAPSSSSASERAAAAEKADHLLAVQVYAAVIRKLVLGVTGAAPDASPYKRVWVVDRVFVSAGQPDGPDRAVAVFSEALKADLTRALSDLPPLAFVADPDTTLIHDKAAVKPLRDRIRGNGTVILLGPIENHGGEVQVGHEAWCAAHCAEWFTSVLEQRDGTWVVTGETGPHAIT